MQAPFRVGPSCEPTAWVALACVVAVGLMTLVAPAAFAQDAVFGNVETLLDETGSGLMGIFKVASIVAVIVVGTMCLFGRLPKAFIAAAIGGMVIAFSAEPLVAFVQSSLGG